MSQSKTLFDKVWASHVVFERDGEPTLLYIDLHLVHEVTSPQAFEGLRLAHRKVRRPDLTFATIDHNVPTTTDERFHIKDQIAAQQIATLRKNCEASGIPLFDIGSGRQGIVHVIGPELGLTQPGKTIVCGDSHTSTHGALGALAFGIGSTEVAHVLATQCLLQRKPRTLAVKVCGALAQGVSAKDLILAIVGRIGISAGVGHVIEYRGDTIAGLDMEERMTVCNMSIEAGARAGMIAPDDTTFTYLQGRPRAPAGEAWERALEEWRQLPGDAGARFDREVDLDAAAVEPMITYGTNPGMVIPIGAHIPQRPDDPVFARALEYMGLNAGEPIKDQPVNVVFIGSCTNARLSDLRTAH